MKPKLYGRRFGLSALMAILPAICMGCDAGDRKTAMATVSDGNLGETADVAKLTSLYSQGADLGVGYGMRAGALLTAARCLDTFDVERTGLNITEKRVTVVQNKQQLEGMLGIEGTGSFVVGPVSVTISAGFGGAMDDRATSVFVLVLIERKMSEFRIAEASLSGQNSSGGVSGLAALFRDNHDAFEKKCGDHFVKSIITGGRYIGLIEIEAGNQANKLDIEASLFGKFIPFGIGVEGGFKFFLEQVASRYRVHIRAASQGIPSPSMFHVDTGALGEHGQGDDAMAEEAEIIEALIADDIDSFFEDVDNFYKKMNEIEQEQDYRENAFMMTFEGYERAAMNRPTPDKRALLMRERLEEMLVVYDDYLQRIREMVKFPEAFEFDESIEAPSAMDKDELEETAADLRYAMRVLKHHLLRCSSDQPTTCITEEALSELSIVTIDWLEASLPKPKIEIPASCTDLKCLLGYREDGLYRVFLNRDPSRPFDIYCRDMDNDLCPPAGAGLPRAYLRVAPIGSADRTAGEKGAFNFSTYTAAQLVDSDITDNIDAGVDPMGEAVSVFDLVPVHINSGNIIVRPPAPTETMPHRRFGVAETASDHGIVQAPDGGVADGGLLLDVDKAANIDLSSTPFRVSPEVRWTVHQQPVTLVSDDNGLLDFDAAALDARCRGGILATVVTPRDMEILANELEYAGVDAAWVGLRCADNDDRFRWDGGKSYDYTAYLNHPNDPCAQAQCVAVTHRGKLDIRSCETPLAYFVERAKYTARAEMSPQGKQVDLYLSSHNASSVLLEPENDLVLEYEERKEAP